MGQRLPALALPLIAAAGFAWSTAAVAHGDAGTRSLIASAGLGVLLAVALFLYVRGLRALWRSAGHGRGVVPLTAWMFLAGWAVLVASLFGPIDRWGAASFTAHMIQHELLMLAAAPLLVMGAPLATWAWAMPAGSRTRTGRVTRAIGHSRAWRAITRPLWATLLHGLLIWAWHVPVLFEAALRSEAIHDLQHATFIGTALLFWWSLLRGTGARRADGLAVILLFATMVHTGALGALLTFSSRPWYAFYADGSVPWGLSPIEDQQLGGLVMWVPCGIVYLIAALALMARWLRPAQGDGERELIQSAN